MARVNVDQVALSDSRYRTAARLFGMTHYEVIGRMIYVWNECQERERYYLPGDTLNAIFDDDNAGEKLARSGLVRGTKTRGFYVKGSKGRVEWLANRRKDGKKGGRPPKTLRLTPGGDGKQRADNPPAPAPAPAQKSKSTPTVEGFQRRAAASTLQRECDIPKPEPGHSAGFTCALCSQHHGDGPCPPDKNP